MFLPFQHGGNSHAEQYGGKILIYPLIPDAGLWGSRRLDSRAGAAPEGIVRRAVQTAYAGSQRLVIDGQPILWVQTGKHSIVFEPFQMIEFAYVSVGLE